MPAPRTAARFGTEYFRLLTLTQNKFESGESFFELPMASEKMAIKTRFRFYAFRKALERDITKHADDSIREERKREFRIADIMRLKVVQTKTGYAIRVENAASEGTDEAASLASALASLELDFIPENSLSIAEELEKEDQVLETLGIEKVERASDLFDTE